MVSPTWTDWFVRDEVEGANPDGLSLWYLGCNGFVLRSETTTIYLDPYFGIGEHRPYPSRMIPVPLDPEWVTACDAVLTTHEHVDHLHPPSYEPLLNTGGVLYATEQCLANPSYGEEPIRTESTRSVTPGDTIEIGDLTVHVRGANDPNSVDPVTYVIEHDSGAFFHAGDSKPTNEFEKIGEEFDLNLGAIAYGSVGHHYAEGGSSTVRQLYMSVDDVVSMANTLELNRLVPTHWDMWKGFRADPAEIHHHASSFPYPRVLEVATVGDRLGLDQPGIRSPCYVERAHD